MPNRPGFKALNSLGYDVDVAGKIYNRTNESVAGFNNSHLSVGSVVFESQSSETYTAVIKLPD